MDFKSEDYALAFSGFSEAAVAIVLKFKDGIEVTESNQAAAQFKFS